MNFKFNRKNLIAYASVLTVVTAFFSVEAHAWLANMAFFRTSGVIAQELNSNWTPEWSHVVALWHLDEPTGISATGSVKDSSPSGINGTPSNSPGFGSSGPLGTAVALNGSNYIEFGNPSNLPSGSSPRSICTWAMNNNTSGNYSWAIAYGYPNNDQAMFIGAQGATLVGGGYADDLRVDNFWVNGAWNHVCLTYDGGTATLYANGVQVSQYPKPWNLVLNEVRIGQQVNGNSEYWNGSVDEVAIWNTALTSAEVLTIYNKQVPAREINSVWAPEWASIVGVWHLDETSGSSIADSSGHSHLGFAEGSVSPTLGITGHLLGGGDFSNGGSTTTSHFNVGTFDPFNGGTTFSLSFWFKWNGTNGTYQCLVSKRMGYGASTVSWQLATGSNNATTNFYNSTNGTGAFNLPSDGLWHMYTFSQTATQAIQYLDGVAQTDNGPLTIPGAAAAMPVNIGDCNTDSNFNGQIDEVAMWSTGLSSAEVLAIYNKQR